MIADMDPVTAFVLAGGKSTRMGTDKAFLELSGRSLLANAMHIAHEVAGEVRIVGDPSKYSRFGAVVSDVYRDRGPLGGIHAALSTTSTDLNLVLGVDLPLIEGRFLAYLISQAVKSSALVTVPQVGTHFEPLCAVYRKGFAQFAESALAKGDNKIDALFTEIELRTIGEPLMAELGFSAAMFRNVNTPEEWRLAQEELAARKHVS